MTAGRKAKLRSKYEALIGRTVDAPAPIFSVDIPDLYYRGTVLKKDPAHPGMVTLLSVSLHPLPHLRSMHTTTGSSDTRGYQQALFQLVVY